MKQITGIDPMKLPTLRLWHLLVHSIDLAAGFSGNDMRFPAAHGKCRRPSGHAGGCVDALGFRLEGTHQ